MTEMHLFDPGPATEDRAVRVRCAGPAAIAAHARAVCRDEGGSVGRQLTAERTDGTGIYESAPQYHVAVRSRRTRLLRYPHRPYEQRHLKFHGCRCRPCAVAAREYEDRRRRERAYGRPRTVDAEPVRAHIRSLMAPKGGSNRGMGWKRIGALAGVSNGAMTKLLWGVDGRPPSRRVRTETARRLMAVTLDLADGASVKAGPTRRMLDAMVAGGFAKAELGRYLTGDVRTRSLQVGTSRYVTVATAAKVADLHARWQAGEIVPRGRWNRHEFGPPPPFPATPAPPRCEDCGGAPWQDGRWCWGCYQTHRRAA